MEIETTLFTALTRQPERLGMPIIFWLVGLVFPMIVYIPTSTFGFWAGLLIPPSWMLMGYLSKRDPFILIIIRKKFKKTPPTSNSQFWGGNSYAP